MAVLSLTCQKLTVSYFYDTQHLTNFMKTELIVLKSHERYKPTNKHT